MSKTTTSNAAATKPRLVQLDILRGLAIFLVLGCHFAMNVGYQGTGVLRHVNAAFERFGWAGVDLFFVLSGFLVGGLLFQELKRSGSLDVRRFLIRRAFKIWPLYFAYVGLMMVRYALANRSVGFAVGSWWPNLLHIQNYFVTVPRRHTWSLAVEEHFYLALPLVLWLVTSRRWPDTTSQSSASAKTSAGNSSDGAMRAIPALPLAAIVVMVFCTTLRVVACLQHPENVSDPYPLMYSMTHMRADSLFFGVLLAYWHYFEPQRLQFARHHAARLLWLGIALVSPLVFISRQKSWLLAALGYNLLYLGFGAMLLAFIYTDPRSAGGSGWMARFFDSFAARVLAFVGIFSYPIYLWHFDLATLPMGHLAKQALVREWPAEVRWVLLLLLNCVVAVGVGIFWTRLLEKPSLVLRDRLFPSRTAVVVDSAPTTEAAPLRLGEQALR